MVSTFVFKFSVTQASSSDRLGITVEPLNVNSLKKGHLLYSGHFVLSQRDIKVY